MNSILSIHALRFFALVILQVLILNHINFMGYINPYAYLLFIAFFPVKNNRMVLILSSFFLGLTIDMFQDTGGMHAAACVFIAYARPVILKFSFGAMYEYHSIRFNAIEFGSLLTYISLLAIAHHLILFSLEVFSISKIILILQKTLFSSIFTIIVCVSLTIVFSKNSK